MKRNTQKAAPEGVRAPVTKNTRTHNHVAGPPETELYNSTVSNKRGLENCALCLGELQNAKSLLKAKVYQLQVLGVSTFYKGRTPTIIRLLLPVQAAYRGLHFTPPSPFHPTPVNVRKEKKLFARIPFGSSSCHTSPACAGVCG